MRPASIDPGQFLRDQDGWVGEFVEQRLGLLQIEHGEPLGEPAVDWPEEGMCLSVSTLISPEPREISGGTEFE